MNNNFYTWSLSAFRNFSIGNQLANCSLTNISKFSQNSKHQGQERWLLPGLAEDSWLTHSAHWVPHNCHSSGSREFNIPGLRGHGHSWAHTCTHMHTCTHTGTHIQTRHWYSWAHTCTNKHMYTHTYMHAGTHTQGTGIHVPKHAHTHMYMCACTHIQS